MSNTKQKKLNPPSSEVAVVLEPEKEKQLTEFDQRLAKACEAARLLGMAQAGKAFASVIAQFNVKAFAALKENKNYKLIQIPDRTGQLVTPNNEEMLCQLAFNMSASRANALLREYQVLGEELHDLMQTTKLSQRTMTAFSRIANDDRTLIEKQIYEHRDNPDAIADLVTTALNQATAKTEKVEADLRESRAKHKATQDVLDDQVGRNTKLDTEIRLLQNLPVDEALDKAQQRLMFRTKITVSFIRRMDTAAQAVLEADVNPKNHTLPHDDIVDAVHRVYREIQNLALNLGLPTAQFTVPDLWKDGKPVAIQPPAESESSDVLNKASNVAPFPGSPETKQ